MHFDEDEDYLPINNLLNRRRLGLDPGRKELFVAVDDQDEAISCTTKRYYHMCGFKRKQQWQVHRLKANGYIRAIVNSTYYLDEFL